jgi:hypothetical protein
MSTRPATTQNYVDGPPMRHSPVTDYSPSATKANHFLAFRTLALTCHKNSAKRAHETKPWVFGVFSAFMITSDEALSLLETPPDGEEGGGGSSS